MKLQYKPKSISLLFEYFFKMLDTTEIKGHKAEAIQAEAAGAYDLHPEYGSHGYLYDIYFFDGDTKHKIASIEETTNDDPHKETKQKRTIVEYRIDWGEEDDELNRARSKLESIVHAV